MLSLTASASAQRTIVGRWAETAAGCAKNSDAAIIIAPMAINAAELSCQFRTVKTRGRGGDMDRPVRLGRRAERPTTVIARESDGRLVLSYSTGGASPRLRRCE